MLKHFLVAACLLAASSSALWAQTKTKTTTTSARPTEPAVVTSLKAHAAQYFTDLSQRQRDIYFAPSDGRAIAVLSNTITEFAARKKGLVAEAEQLQKLPATMLPPQSLNLQSPTWAQDQQTLLASPAAAKMKTRRQKNPALEAAFRRLEAAQLATLPSPLVPGQ